MTRRSAVAALAAIVAVMTKAVRAEAQEPVLTHEQGTISGTLRFAEITEEPQRVQFDLRTFERYVFTIDGKMVTLTPDEMFNALQPKETP